MTAEWRQNPIAPKRRTRKWTGVVLYDWVMRVPGVNQAAALVYGAVVEGAGSTSLCRNLSLQQMGERLGRRPGWVREQLRVLEDSYLLIREEPQGQESALRWRLVNHPLAPGYFDDGYVAEFYALETAELVQQVWVEESADCGYRDDIGTVARLTYDLVYTGRRHADLLLHELDAFLELQLPASATGQGWPVFEEWKATVNWLEVAPREWMFSRGWWWHRRSQMLWDQKSGLPFPTYDQMRAKRARWNAERDARYGNPYEGVDW